MRWEGEYWPDEEKDPLPVGYGQHGFSWQVTEFFAE